MSRRGFVAGAASVGSAMAIGVPLRAQGKNAPFRLSVINDEISQDFDHVCYVVAKDFGLEHIELRTMWDKNVTVLSDTEVDQAKKILAKYKLTVTDIASPLFKTDLPGAPMSNSKERPKHDEFKANADYAQQDALLEHCIGLAKNFGTNKIRCFDFWRLDDQKPFRAEIDRKLRQASEKLAPHGLELVLENEFACNTATGLEAVATLRAVPNANFKLNWDPANSGVIVGDVPYPTDFDALPFARVAHCHAKNLQRKPDGTTEWEPVDIGLVDWVGQLSALAKKGYRGCVSLETHWRGAGTPEASSRRSMQGLQDCLAKAGLRAS